MAARIGGGKSICRNNICPEERYRPFFFGGEEGFRSLTGGARGGAERRAKRTRGRINFRATQSNARRYARFLRAQQFSIDSPPLCYSLLLILLPLPLLVTRAGARNCAHRSSGDERSSILSQYASLQGYIRHVSSLSFFYFLLSPPPPPFFASVSPLYDAEVDDTDGDFCWRGFYCKAIHKCNVNRYQRL